MRASSAPVLDRLLAILEETGTSLWRRRPFAIATVGALAVTLAFPAFLALTLSGLAKSASKLAASERLRAFMLADATPADVDAVMRRLRATPGVDGVASVSREQARAAFSARFPDLARASRSIGDDQLHLPASVEAWGSASPLALEALARDVAVLPGVEEARYDAAAAQRLDATAQSLRVACAVLAVAALLATALGLANVIRIGALARREQLTIMRLVGAPRLHVRAPFVLEGIVQGAAAGIVAGILVRLALALMGGLAQAPGLPADLPLRAWVILAVLPGLAGGLAAALAVESVLRHHAQLER
jgi:cell division transport system permease protein